VLEAIRELAEEAGRATLRYYRKDVEVETKADDSPLTAADRAAHEILDAGLRRLRPDLPVLSEEGSAVPVEERRRWASFFLVDPLDGTKEFVHGRDEFTVNVARIEDGRPTLGVVHAPVLGITWAAAEGEGAWRFEGAARTRLATRTTDPERLALVCSRSHAGPALEKVLAARPDIEAKSFGSSLKFCMVASGDADLYPRLGPTMEWDTGAAQCVVEQAGGQVLGLEGEPLGYNKAVLRNPSFVVVGDPSYDWRSLLAPGLELAASA